MIGILFIIIPLVLIAGAIYYLSKRFSLFTHTPTKGWLCSLGIITIFMLVSQYFFSMGTNEIGRIINIISSFWLVSLVCMVLSLAVSDFIYLFIKIKPSIRALLSLGLFTVIMIYGIANAYSLKVNEVTIPIKGLTKEIRAVHISDIHLGNYRGEKYLNKIVNTINELNPDVLFNTGDMFDSKAHFHNRSNVLQPLKNLTMPHYFVYGNHDQYVGVEKVIKRMEDAGAIVLQNEAIHFGELQVIGLNNMAKDSISFDPHAIPGSETVESVMNKITIGHNQPTLILHHRPEGVEYMEAVKNSLLLSGHTHAGQLFPFTLIAKGMFTYNKGLYQHNDMSIYVTEGVGTIFVPLRIGTHSEITLINMVPEER